ncbi:MAG: tRNA uridine-5-carboxymethylaminomethyl modification enzyme MnmG/GidA [Spirochaetaceae bacterium]
MDFDAVVIGAGHAGIEAALALARLDHSTLLVTQHLDAVAKLSCNPAIGGLAKGNLVREIDALGGEMGRLIDRTMIQFRILNRSRGPAVQAPRAQADKLAYHTRAKQALEEQKGLWLFQDTVVDLILDDTGRRVQGVVTERGRRFTTGAVVLTTGTFLNGRIFIGGYSAAAGRLGEPPSYGLDRPLREAGFSMGRLKTGTPARIAGSSIDFEEMEVQEGDPQMLPFSFTGAAVGGADDRSGGGLAGGGSGRGSPDMGLVRPQRPCYITFTNDETHRVIRENMDASPLYSGKIVGVGPRYCPSIEDKVVKFPDRNRHQIFVEPEGLDTEEMYLNGISSSLPEEVQERFIRTLPGLRHAHIARPGYAVEYDYIDSTQLYPSLESKPLAGLFVAGQTNGSSGYEEAAAQGLMAGINASRRLRGERPFVLSRADAYIGVLVDDMVTTGTREPYRMFTSRAEHRLSLRHGSADRRLTRRAYEIGLQGDEAVARLAEKERGIEEVQQLLRSRRADEEVLAALPGGERHRGKSLEQILKDPRVTMDQLATALPELTARYHREWRSEVELDVKYEGYIRRQERQIERFRRLEDLEIPPSFDYDRLEGISNEAREKLKAIRPYSVGQASRISGVRNADITVLLVGLGRRERAS